MRGINQEYILNAIDELTELLGIKDDVPLESLFHQFNSGNIKRCIEDIARYLGLPIAISLSYVPANNPSRNTANRFESSSLSQTNKANRGVAVITAQVDIPANLPFYGSSELTRFPINVRISEDCKDDPAAFIPVMAHELSHVLLYSLRFKEKDNEYYTDLTAMILGFSEVMKDAQDLITKIDTTQQGNTFHQVVHKSKYGYLTDEQFKFATNRIGEIMWNNIQPKIYCVRTLDDCMVGIRNYKKELYKFKNYLKHLDKKQKKNINNEDSLKIVSFHQLDYAEGLEERLASYEKGEKRISKYTQGIIHYTKMNISSLRDYHEESKALLFDIKKDLDLLKQDVSVLEKYVGFIYKYRINRR